MQLKSLVPMLSVADVEKTLRFYQESLGFEVIHRHERGGFLRWAMGKAGETELMFARCDVSQSVLPFDTKEHLVLYFRLDNVEVLHALLREKEYPVSSLRVTCYRMQEFDLRDPDGYQLRFGQETGE
jgi:catechol 2,3-dioxygenase-like lactoylglutathione lyase family enzyme